MRLQAKIMLIMIATWAGICLLVFVDTRYIIADSYKTLEKSITQHRIQDTQRAYDRMLYSLSLYTVAWSQWNESYQFMQVKNDQFIKSNLIAATYKSSAIDFILFFDNKGNLYFGQYYNNALERILPVPIELLNYLKTNTSFFSQQTKSSIRVGILNTKIGLIVMSARPILKSDGKGPVRGSLLMGYYLDNTFFDTLAKTVGMPIQFFPMAEIANNAALTESYKKLTAGDPDSQVLVNDKLKYGFMLLKDIHSEPVGLVRISMPRNVYQQGLQTAYNYSAIVLLSALIVTLLVWYLLRMFVLKRVFHISKQILKINKSKEFDHQIIVSGQDELKKMVFIINDMLNVIATSQKQLNFLALHDILTGLPNRAYFYKLLQHQIDKANTNQTKLAVMFLDMDKLKNTNDNYGHLVGDELIRQAANRMRDALNKDDVAAHLSGDEFIIFMPNITDVNLVKDMAEKILQTTAKPFVIDGLNITTSFSIGISLYPDDATTIDKLIQQADDVMYIAKKRSGNSYQFYSDKINHIA